MDMDRNNQNLKRIVRWLKRIMLRTEATESKNKKIIVPLFYTSDFFLITIHSLYLNSER